MQNDIDKHIAVIEKAHKKIDNINDSLDGDILLVDFSNYKWKLKNTEKKLRKYSELCNSVFDDLFVKPKKLKTLFAFLTLFVFIAFSAYNHNYTSNALFLLFIYAFIFYCVHQNYEQKFSRFYKGNKISVMHERKYIEISAKEIVKEKQRRKKK